MFIYQKNGNLCVTFKGNKPVDMPEYVIVIDEDNKDVIINGKSYVQLTTKVVEEKPVLTTKKTAAPVIKEEKPEIAPEKELEKVVEE